MKRILSIFVALTILVSVCVMGSTQASAATASVIADSSSAVSCNVGEVFVYKYYLNVGTNKVASVQATTTYDSSKLELLVDYIPEPDDDSFSNYTIPMFPIAYRANLVCNFDIDSKIAFNFASGASGVRFNTDTSALIVLKFRVKEAGTTTIKTDIEYMEEIVGSGAGTLVKVIFDGKVASGYTIKQSGEVKRGTNFITGDTDGDGKVSIMDATYIQLKRAEIAMSDYNDIAEDCDHDNKCSIMDAYYIQLYRAEIPSPLEHVTVGKPDVKIN